MERNTLIYPHEEPRTVWDELPQSISLWDDVIEWRAMKRDFVADFETKREVASKRIIKVFGITEAEYDQICAEYEMLKVLHIRMLERRRKAGLHGRGPTEKEVRMLRLARNRAERQMNKTLMECHLSVNNETSKP